MTDGPYTESKELVGGFFIIEAADRQEAVRVASIHPAANLGEQVGWGIEIHPIGFFEQYGGRPMTPGCSNCFRSVEQRIEDDCRHAQTLIAFVEPA